MLIQFSKEKHRLSLKGIIPECIPLFYYWNRFEEKAFIVPKSRGMVSVLTIKQGTSVYITSDEFSVDDCCQAEAEVHYRAINAFIYAALDLMIRKACYAG